jgi:UDP-glucose 4-epimerase
MLEKYILMFVALQGLPATIVRPSNAYGEYQQPFTGQGFIATAIKSILARQAVDIFGPGGTVRDYLHVEDIARGIIAALDFGKPSEVYNIGCGIGRNNLDVLETIRNFAEPSGYAVGMNIFPEREFDVPVNILDSSKLRSISAWRPEIDFQEGVLRTWMMYEAEKERSRQFQCSLSFPWLCQYTMVKNICAKHWKVSSRNPTRVSSCLLLMMAL